MFLKGQVANLIVGKTCGNYLGFQLKQNLQRLTKMEISTSTVRGRFTGESRKAVVAVGQMRSTKNKVDNLNVVESLIENAKSKKASFLFLPECCDFVADNRMEMLELAEPLNGETVEIYKKWAKKYNMWLSIGGLHESILDKDGCKTDKIYNSHIIINDSGEMVSVYRKLHLFDVDTPEFRFRESDAVTPGPRSIPPVVTPIGYIGLQICYDMRFAEPSLLLRKAGAQILTYPSAFAFSTGTAHWEVLLRARAIENQCYVVAAAQVGFHNAKRQSWGHAMVVNPWGKIIADCGATDECIIATADIDVNTIKAITNSMPVFDHRRSDVYSLIAYDGGMTNVIRDRYFGKHLICHKTIFYETGMSFAFTNIRSVVTGHVLVATKRVTPRLVGLSCEEMSDLFTVVCKIQRMLDDIYSTKSSTVTVQDGVDAGQTVPHVHFHVLPRRPGDFEPNDDVYIKLDGRGEVTTDRDITDRIDEARLYRNYLKN